MPKIQFKRSSVAGKVPLTSDLDLGELAINTNDGLIYMKRNNGSDSIVKFSPPVIGENGIPVRYTSTVGPTEGRYRIATLALSAAKRSFYALVIGKTAAGTMTETIITIPFGYRSDNVGSQTFAIQAHTTHSFNSNTNAENGWVLSSVTITTTTTQAFVDINWRKTSISGTIEVLPLADSDWVFSSGALTVNPTLGTVKNNALTLSQGHWSNYTYAQASGVSDYSNYGAYAGTGTLSNTTNKTNNWHYFGYIAFQYNASFLNGYRGQYDIRLLELFNTPGMPTKHLDLNVRLYMPPTGTTALFNSTVPQLELRAKGDHDWGADNQIAALVFSTSTSEKLIRLYVKSQYANQHWNAICYNRYGFSYNTSNTPSTSSSPIYYHATSQAVVANLPTPAQGSIVYAKSQFILAKHVKHIRLRAQLQYADIADQFVDVIFNHTQYTLSPTISRLGVGIYRISFTGTFPVPYYNLRYDMEDWIDLYANVQRTGADINILIHDSSFAKADPTGANLYLDLYPE